MVDKLKIFIYNNNIKIEKKRSDIMLDINYDRELEEFYVKTKIGRQTFYMAFQKEYEDCEKIYFNVYLTLYTKRKYIDKNEVNIIMTGENPIQTIITAKKAFNALEKNIVLGFAETISKKVVIYCTWLDTKRKSVYYKVLSKKGYDYGRIPGYKDLCIMKTFYSKEDLK